MIDDIKKLIDTLEDEKKVDPKEKEDKYYNFGLQTAIGQLKLIVEKHEK